jgi:hypothetical protein
MYEQMLEDYEDSRSNDSFNSVEVAAAQVKARA